MIRMQLSAVGKFPCPYYQRPLCRNDISTIYFYTFSLMNGNHLNKELRVVILRYHMTKT